MSYLHGYNGEKINEMLIPKVFHKMIKKQAFVDQEMVMSSES